MNIKRLWEEGAEAYRRGKKPEDNPFEPHEYAESYQAWKHGYEVEKDFWESQSSGG